MYGEYPLLVAFENREKEPGEDLPTRILFTVMGNVMSRGGFASTWNHLHVAMRDEILKVNLELIKANLPK